MDDAVLWIVYIAFFVLSVAGMWMTFQKAGHPGWAAIIPIYNVYILLKIADKPVWYLILFFIPFVNFIAAIIVSIAVAEKFGKSALFGIGLAFLPLIFYMILGFGSAQYRGRPAGAM